MLKLIKSNDEYNNNLGKYDKTDGILAVTLFFIVIFMYALFGFLYKSFFEL